MLRTLLGFDWRKSNAHLLLLSKFLRPKTTEDFLNSDQWKTVLGEGPKQAIRHFLDAGVLAQADLPTQLDYKFKVTELKDMLKGRGLPVSGRKGDLIQRLIQADPESSNKAVAGMSILQCSEHGRQIGEQYLGSEKAKRNSVEQQVMVYLQQHRFKEASMAVASYEAEQVFQRGLGIDWRQHSPDRDIATLETILERRPKILGRLNDNQVNALRLAAGMMLLWGTNQAKGWLPPDFETGLAMDNDAAVRMFLFQATHFVSLDEYRRSGVVKFVRVLGTRDSCDACNRVSGKKYKLNEVPELPYEHCISEMGCRCTLIPITD